MTDVSDIRFARLGGMLEQVEEKAAAPPKAKGKGGKVRPKPPWLDDDADAEDTADDGADEDTEDTPPRRGGKKALPGKVPAGFKAKKPVPAQNTARVRRRQTVTSPRGNLARVQHASRGTSVSLRTLPAPAGIKKKSVQAGNVVRPTMWGPPNQRVDITRARVATTGSDARVSAAAGRRSNGPTKPYGRGPAGGDGVTGGRGPVRAARVAPGNLHGGGGRGKVRHSGQMGEGAAWGKSGSAITPHKPGNIKSLYDYSEEEIRGAIDVAAKALRGVLADYDTAGE